MSASAALLFAVHLAAAAQAAPLVPASPALPPAAASITLPPDAPIRVTTLDRRALTGRFVSASPRELSLTVDVTRQRVDLPIAAVDTIERIVRDPVHDGVFKGLAIGAGGGAVFGGVAALTCDPHQFLGCFPSRGAIVFGNALLGAGVGALAGWVADWLHPSHRIVYRRSGA